MGRRILFVTTDQQRYDSLGCNGGRIARTPVADGLAATGLNYHRAHNANTVCTPARSSMITGQYVSTHGVVSNGIALPPDAPSVAHVLNDAGYRTALIGKAHFEPALDFERRWFENRMAGEGKMGPYRGFDHMELCMHGYYGPWHYDKWLEQNHPEFKDAYFPLLGDGGLNNDGGGDTGGPELKYSPISREAYHTDWVAKRTIDWLDSMGDSDDWFCWMSFPDPHHPWDPPADEVRARVNWRDLDLPGGHPGSVEKSQAILGDKPAHWLAWFEGRMPNLEGGPAHFVPAEMSHDVVREVNAMVHVENELIDEALGRVLEAIRARGWDDDVDIFFTTDHGEFQGDFGLLFKGPYHVDALMRLPLIWRPAPSSGVTPADVHEPVSQVDLAATFCAIAGVDVPEWMQGRPLPTAAGDPTRERVITEWDSQFPQMGMHMRTIYRDGFTLTTYQPSHTHDAPAVDMIKNLAAMALNGKEVPVYVGTEGELYDHANDPHQHRNLWDDPDYAGIKRDLLADLADNLPPQRETPLAVEAPV